MSMQQRAEVVAETLKAAPPVAVAGLTVAGVSLSDVVLIATLMYLVLQIGYLAHKWYRLWNHRKEIERIDREDE